MGDFVSPEPLGIRLEPSELQPSIFPIKELVLVPTNTTPTNPIDMNPEQYAIYMDT